MRNLYRGIAHARPFAAQMCRSAGDVVNASALALGAASTSARDASRDAGALAGEAAGGEVPLQADLLAVQLDECATDLEENLQAQVQAYCFAQSPVPLVV